MNSDILPDYIQRYVYRIDLARINDPLKWFITAILYPMQFLP